MVNMIWAYSYPPHFLLLGPLNTRLFSQRLSTRAVSFYCLSFLPTALLFSHVAMSTSLAKTLAAHLGRVLSTLHLHHFSCNNYIFLYCPALFLHFSKPFSVFVMLLVTVPYITLKPFTFFCIGPYPLLSNISIQLLVNSSYGFVCIGVSVADIS